MVQLDEEVYRVKIIGDDASGEMDYMYLELGSLERATPEQFREIPDVSDFRTRQAGFFAIHVDQLDHLNPDQKEKLGRWIQEWL